MRPFCQSHESVFQTGGEKACLKIWILLLSRPVLHVSGATVTEVTLDMSGGLTDMNSPPFIEIRGLSQSNSTENVPRLLKKYRKRELSSLFNTIMT